MSALWQAPLLMVLLVLGWFAVQQAWLAVMQRPPDSDALQRPGLCGNCDCSGRCSRGRQPGESRSEPEEKTP